MKTNNGKKGGLLKGKPHYDKDGNPVGGIKAVVTDTGQPVELEGGEVIINKKAAKKHWRELSKINQSAGNGVPIQPPAGTDTEAEQLKKGGKIGKELKKGIKAEKEHKKTIKKIYDHKVTPDRAYQLIAEDHLQEKRNYYSELQKMEKKLAKGGILSGSSYSIPTPTGKPSKLTYLQQILVRTKAFKKWFGDWEECAKKHVLDDRDNKFEEHYKNCSYIIDFDTLEPKIVYHGTRSDTEFFELHTHTREVGRPYAYFAYNLEYSENFANSEWKEGNSFLYHCFANIKQPFSAFGKNYDIKENTAVQWFNLIIVQVIRKKFPNQTKPTPEMDAFMNQVWKEIYPYCEMLDDNIGVPFYFWKFMAYDKDATFKNFLIKNGYDGIVYTENMRVVFDVTNPAEFTLAVTIFESNQTKLADGRNVTFDPKNKDIRFEDGGIIQHQQNIKKLVLKDAYVEEPDEVSNNEMGMVNEYGFSNKSYIKKLFKNISK